MSPSPFDQNYLQGVNMAFKIAGIQDDRIKMQMMQQIQQQNMVTQMLEQQRIKAELDEKIRKNAMMQTPVSQFMKPEMKTVPAPSVGQGLGAWQEGATMQQPTGRTEFQVPPDATLEMAAQLMNLKKAMAPDPTKYQQFKPGEPIGIETPGQPLSFITAPGIPKQTEVKLQHVTEDKGDKYRQGTFNPVNGQYQWGDWQPKGISPTSEITDKRAAQRFGLQLRTQFNGLQPVKDFRDVTAKYQVMSEAFKESEKTNNFVAVDQALITLFNKMTDPSSVVRESEYARTPQDLALWNRLKGKIEKYKAGGAGLTAEDRQALLTMGSKFMSVYGNIYRQYENEYRGYSVSAGLNPDDIIKPIGDVNVIQKPNEPTVIKGKGWKATPIQ